MILAFLAIAASTAILICPLPAPAQAAGLLFILLWGGKLWRATRCNRFLYHHGGPDDIINQWSFSVEHERPLDGVLIHQGYRSAGLLIVVLRANDDGRIVRIPVWRDSVTPLEFSYLNLQLLFNTKRRETRSIGG